MIRNMIFATMALSMFSTFCHAKRPVTSASKTPFHTTKWQTHTVLQLNGLARKIPLSAQFQIISAKSSHQVVTIPYQVYMPEKDRLLMLASYGYPHRPFTLTSDDHGANWTDPVALRVDKDGNPAGGLGLGLAYLGDGNALLYSGGDRWFSRDYGKTWGEAVAKAPSSDGKGFSVWCPPLVDRDKETGKVTLMAESGYAWFKRPDVTRDHQQAYIRFSRDAGKTWNKDIKVPQWKAVSEVTLFRAGNGDMLAACRTDMPHWIEDKEPVLSPTVNDGYEGMGISISKDNGQTWSTVKKLYDYGRHHSDFLLMPNRDIIMTYVVRAGYVDAKNGFPQYGIEAVISRDNGQTWDLDHRYIIDSWVGNQKGQSDWWPAPYCATSSLLPDGSIITLFGTAYSPEPGSKSKNQFTQRVLGLVKWRLNPDGVNNDRTFRDASFDSDLRNLSDPSP